MLHNDNAIITIFLQIFCPMIISKKIFRYALVK